MSNLVKDQANENVATKKRSAWIRRVVITLKSQETGKEMVFDNYDTKHSFAISITGQKEVAINKDKGTIAISNLEYDVMMKIILLKYYDIEIKIGYKNIGDLETVAKGEVAFINQKIHSKHDVTTYIMYASPMVARFSQSRLNFNLNSGVNIYTAINYLCRLGGIGRRVNIDPRLRLEVLNKVYNEYNKTSIILQNILDLNDTNISNSGYMITTDGSENGSYVNILNIKNSRKIKIDPNTINIAKGNPTVTSSGLKICLLPTINYRPGDILVLDNALIDIARQSVDVVTSSFNENFLDQNGQYMVLTVEYTFQTRGQTFEFNITARAVDLILKQQLGVGSGD